MINYKIIKIFFFLRTLHFLVILLSFYSGFTKYMFGSFVFFFILFLSHLDMDVNGFAEELIHLSYN